MQQTKSKGRRRSRSAAHKPRGQDGPGRTGHHAPRAARPSSAKAEQQPQRREPLPLTNPVLILISAPSGGGKTTVVHQLLAARPDMTRVVTCTTREPRPGEVDGVDYYFLTAASFLKRLQAGNFLEHAIVYGHSYGTLKSEVLGKLRQGKDVLLNVDVQGAATIRERAQQDSELKRALVSVFLTPRSLEILEQRLRRRGTDSEAAIQKRLSVARREIAQWRHFDYLVISDTINEDLRRMQAIVAAEKLRVARAQAPET
ncbi:MAG: guanylate kinase [Verrucomicrobia bacterium]|nr:MAG: guanylate kinase [Verrucomicrobiota bacterium]